jgi:hypothetical protein
MRANRDAIDLAQNITMTIEITGARSLRRRLWMASKILAFGAFIAGMRSAVTVHFNSDN